jgi:hypothetical protein
MAGLTLTTLGVFAGVTSTAAGQDQQVATFNVAYESDYTSEVSETWAAKRPCAGQRGTVNSLDRTGTKTVFRARMLRTPISRGFTYGIIPGSGGPLAPGQPLSVRYQSQTTQSLEALVYDDVTDSCIARPVSAPKPVDCRIKGHLIFAEDLGRVNANFKPRVRGDSCEGDGYAGRTNELRLVGRVKPANLFGKRRNVITAKGGGRYTAVDADEPDMTARTQVDKARWTLTLIRTSGWTRYRK